MKIIESFLKSHSSDKLQQIIYFLLQKKPLNHYASEKTHSLNTKLAGTASLQDN